MNLLRRCRRRLQEGQVAVCAGREAEDGEHGARAEDVRGRAAADDGHEAVARHAHLHRRAGQGGDRATPVPRGPPGRAGAPQLPGTCSPDFMDIRLSFRSTYIETYVQLWQRRSLVFIVW